MHLRALRPACLALCLLAARPLGAHEFWLQPETFFPTTAAPVAVSLQVGMNFTGETRTFSAARVAALRLYSAHGGVDLLSQVPVPPGLAALPLTLTTPGTHLLAEDSTASTITLTADKFNPYLKDEGLDPVIAARAAAGQSDQPGRERYLRCVKTLLRVDGHSDATYATRTGQRLEIVPLADPFALRAGDRLAFAIFFDHRPLAGALVRTWHRDPHGRLVHEARTAADGTVEFAFPTAGPWMISLVHMLPLADDPVSDWQSYWGNLTFAVPAP